MGAVWVAEHLALGTQVAVKFMAPHYIDNEQAVVRFQEEAQKTARIKSPHVTAVFDYGIMPEGEPYIVMELLEGETLRQRMRRAGPMLNDEVVRLVEQTAIGLETAHKLGVVHRDIKPDNLFVLNVGGEPFVKVLDFGIAKQVDAGASMTSTGVPMGTPLYMSPEQFDDPKRIDHRTDLWSLGVVAYEAFTGKPPFGGDTIWALYRAVQKGDFQPPSALRTDLPKAVDEWMAQALSRGINARFTSAREMAEALSAAFRRIVVVPEDIGTMDTPFHVTAGEAGEAYSRRRLSRMRKRFPDHWRTILDGLFFEAQTQGEKLSVIVFELSTLPRLDEVHNDATITADVEEVDCAIQHFVKDGSYRYLGFHVPSGLALVLPGMDLTEARAQAKMLDQRVRGELDKQEITKQLTSRLCVGAARVEPLDKSPLDLLERASRAAREGIC